MGKNNDKFINKLKIDFDSLFEDEELKKLGEKLNNRIILNDESGNELEVNGKKFILTHSGLGSFVPDKLLFEYSRFDLLWTRPSLNKRYYEDGKKVIFEHTPTVLLIPEYKGKPIFTDMWIDIDVGAGIGMSPVLLRLDDLKVFYF